MFKKLSICQSKQRQIVAMTSVILVAMMSATINAQADYRSRGYEHPGDYRHHDRRYSGRDYPRDYAYGKRHKRYRDDAFGRYKYPRGRPIPGDGLNRGNRPGDGLNYGRDARSGERYPHFRKQPHIRSYSDNSGPRQREPVYRDGRDGWQEHRRSPSRRDNYRDGYGYRGYRGSGDRGRRHGYDGYGRGDGRQYYRRPSSSNAYTPRITQ